MIEKLSYDEYYYDIKDDYEDLLNEETITFNFEEATGKIIYEYKYEINEYISNKIIFFIILGKISVEKQIVVHKIKDEIKKIIKEELLEKHKDDFEEEDYNKLTNDLRYLKENIAF